MGYVKLDDAFLDHPKFLEVGPLAGYLALCAIAWSNRNRTDGFIPTAQVQRLAVFSDLAITDGQDIIEEIDVWKLVQDLVLARLWDREERGYRVHDYLDHQNSAADIIELSTARAEAGRKGAEARWGVTARDTQQQTDGKSDGNSDGKSMAKSWLKEEGRTNENTSMPSELGATASRLFSHWQEACRHPTAKFTRDRRSKVEARLREGYSEEQIRQAIDGAARAAFVNDAGKRFDDLELICRSGSKVEDFMGRRGAAPKSSLELAREFEGGAA